MRLKALLLGTPSAFLLIVGFYADPSRAKDCSPREIDFFLSELNKDHSDFFGEAALCSNAIGAYTAKLDKSQSLVTRINAAYVLEQMGDDAKPAVLDLAFKLDPLNSQYDPEERVRMRIAYALGAIRDDQSIVVETLVRVLKDDSDPLTRAAAAYSLGTLKSNSEHVLPSLFEILTEEQNQTYGDVLSESLAAISAYGIESEPYLNDLLALLSSEESQDFRLPLADAIADISLAMYEEVDAQANGHVSILRLKTVWQRSRQLRVLSVKLGDNLKALESVDLAIAYKEVERYKELVDSQQRDLALSMAQQSFGGVGQVAVTHGLVWLALIFAYPRSPMVQTAFFWNPRIRRILGFPYVTGALKWVPFFRKILFIPFRDALRSDANLDLFKGQTYFSDLRVKAEGWSESQPINQVIPKLKGQIVLQGESGSGKSMFLRYLLSQSSRIAVYLPAQKCTQGVIAAIQAKLYGQAQDADFLRDLIYSGAIDIYIDGLNEVTPDTRASIKDFVEKNFKGNIILATQPLEWQPPGQVYHLQPLDLRQIKDFLYSHATAASTTYHQDCAAYLTGVEADLAAEVVPAEEKAMLRQSLANPMDLTVVAQLIASQKQPDLLRLREQQYLTMVEDYQRIYLGRAFPLAAFAAVVYRLRLESQAQIPAADFGDELLCLERHKMVVRRQRSGSDGAGETQWFFRHEKVADFFIAQSFLRAEDDRQTRHLADSRFRGVYLLLATLLPEPQKMALREQLIQYAVRHNDHVLSDAFIRLVGSPGLPPP